MWADPMGALPRTLARKVLYLLPLKDRTRCERVSTLWHSIAMEVTKSETKPVWVYVIFRKNHCSGHEKMTVNISFDGPIFWNRQVAYIYCCSCHFDEHEGPLMSILSKFEHRVERMCIVDRPVDYPFLPDSIFSYMAKSMPKLQFIYLRELDLEKINRATVADLADHATLKKVIVHGCRNYEVLEDFRNLPQLLVVRGEIVGLKVIFVKLQRWCEDAAMKAGYIDRVVVVTREYLCKLTKRHSHFDSMRSTPSTKLLQAMIGEFDEEQSGSSSQSLSQSIAQSISDASDQPETISVEVATGP